MSQQNITSLNLFASYTTRAAYQQKTGQQAPQYDITKPVKTWQDPNPPHPDANGNCTYTWFDAVGASGDGTNGFKTFTVPLAQTGLVNLLGAYVFPPPQPPAPTTAYEYSTLFANFMRPVDASQLSTLDEANGLAADLEPLLPGLTPFEPLAGLIGLLINYNGDSRRIYGLGRKTGSSVVPVVGNVATQLAIRNANGVGAPGHWALSGGNLVWMQDQQVVGPPVGAQVPTVPMPVGPLPAGATLQLMPELGTIPDWTVVTGVTPGPVVSPTPVSSGAGNSIQALVAMLQAMGLTLPQAQAQVASIVATLYGGA